MVTFILPIYAIVITVDNNGHDIGNWTSQTEIALKAPMQWHIIGDIMKVPYSITVPTDMSKYLKNMLENNGHEWQNILVQHIP